MRGWVEEIFEETIYENSPKVHVKVKKHQTTCIYSRSPMTPKYRINKKKSTSIT